MERDPLPGRNFVIFILLGCLFGAAVTAGCMGDSAEPEPEDPTPPEATPGAYTTYSPPAGPKPSFSASVTTPEKRMRTDGSCYWTVTGTVTNDGDGPPARNVVIRFMLIDDQSSMIRATETVLAPPGSRRARRRYSPPTHSPRRL
ncbi:FxLYD domain-containing protein [Methanoculleus chikugoensis]|uniref:FxLYD domain-containing protein n=1 Tax=Methanoculleus chikugoensis TaxID=118126 RepID=UPI000ACFEE5F|nr:FxLYD domain-containing protein [Methanoculleus chikugoensis]